jgi:hypothetical protein
MFSNSRKRITVEGPSQRALVLQVVVYWVFSLVAIGLLTIVWNLGPGPGGPFLDLARYDALLETYTHLIVAALFVLPVLMIDAWIHSNRFAGPVYRLRRCLRELAAGKPVEHVQFRKRDYWQGLGDDLNAVIDQMARLKADAGTSAAPAEPIDAPEPELAGVGQADVRLNESSPTPS